MREWNKENEYNSFNSYKGLLYQDHYKAIVNKAFLPPIEASIDPIHACNLNCSHCNAKRYINGDTKIIDWRHAVKLIGFLSSWGVKAICWGGGGEPTLHPHLSWLLHWAQLSELENAIATNGTMFNKRLIETAVNTCRWIGVSVDAGTAKTYKIGRKKDLFNDVIKNIKSLCREVKKQQTNCDISYKFLICDYNQHEIYKACKLAKSLGVRDFHARPADLNHQGLGNKRVKIQYAKKDIWKQFLKCHKLADKNFRVFTVTHKFDPNFKPRKDFSQCYGAPLIIQICADGKVYFCVDQRHRKEFVLGSHYPNPYNILKFWGGRKHKKLVFGNTPSRCKTRCTGSSYCRQCEQLFANNGDPLCRNFV
jgi:MoaA/NifB/PqqE/SkfB family radical SAM enzyme